MLLKTSAIECPKPKPQGSLNPKPKRLVLLDALGPMDQNKDLCGLRPIKTPEVLNP